MAEEYPGIVRCGVLDLARDNGEYSLFYNNIRAQGIREDDDIGLLFATGGGITASDSACSNCRANLQGVCVDDKTKGERVFGISRRVNLSLALHKITGIIYNHLLLVHSSREVSPKLRAEIDASRIAYQKKSSVWVRERFNLNESLRVSKT